MKDKNWKIHSEKKREKREREIRAKQRGKITQR